MAEHRIPEAQASTVISVAVIRLDHGRDLPLPSYATPGSAGMDLLAAVESEMTLAPGARALVPTGIAIALPVEFEAQIRPRSGLALKFGVTTLNTPGTIDADYRGEVGVILINHGQAPFTIQRGDRIAQLVLAPVTRLHWDERDVLDETARGKGGFGSTGRSAPGQPATDRPVTDPPKLQTKVEIAAAARAHGEKVHG